MNFKSHDRHVRQLVLQPLVLTLLTCCWLTGFILSNCFCDKTTDDATFLTTELAILLFLSGVFLWMNVTKFLIAVLELMSFNLRPHDLTAFINSCCGFTVVKVVIPHCQNTPLRVKALHSKHYLKVWFYLYEYEWNMRIWDLQQLESACLWCTSGESQPSVSGFLSVFAERKEESAASAETWREDRCRHMWCRFGGDSQMATRQDARDAGWLLSVHTGMQLQLIHMYVCIRMYAAVHRVSCSYTHVSQILVWNMKYM